MTTIEILIPLVQRRLNRFLNDRKDKFPQVNRAQKQKWVSSVIKQLTLTLADHDIFYDNMPEDVVEI